MSLKKTCIFGENVVNLRFHKSETKKLVKVKKKVKYVS